MRAASMIKFGWIMLGVYLIISIFFYLTGDKDRGLMFLAGSGLWCIMLLVWAKVKADEDEK